TGTTPDFTYQWQRCDADGTNCTDITGATDDTYTLGAGDIGHAIVVVVTATNDGGTDTHASDASGAVAAAPPHDTVAPDVTGTVTLGGTLSAGDGTWTGTDPGTFDYQWQRCDASGNDCVDIVGATDDTY